MVGRSSTSAQPLWCTARGVQELFTLSKPSTALFWVVLAAVQQVMRSHGAAVVVNVVAALAVGKDLDPLDETGWVRPAPAGWWRPCF